MAHATVREEHPLPAVIMHWLHLVSLAILIFTGFFIHEPFFAAPMGVMRGLHFFFMFVFILVAIVRVYWAFFGAGSSGHGQRTRVRDYKHFGPQKENRGTLVPTLKYYLFMRKAPPPGAKFNGLQKATYMFWLLLIALQAITGFAIWTPTQGPLRGLTYALGGMQNMRAYHYIIMWLFISTVAIHIYLAVVHFDQVRLIFAWKETPATHRDEGTTAASPTVRG